MSPERLPCVKALDRECFRAHPEFARRALAYRLLHLLIPPDLAKRLPKRLSDPLIAPGVEVPLGAEFPPGTVIVPGCDFPAGWDPKDEPPECTKSAPLPTLAMQIAGANPNVFLSPGEPGTGQVKPPPGPPPEPPVVLWFDEPFDNLTKYSWTKYETGTGAVAIVSGHLELDAPTGYAGIYRTDARSVPSKLEILIQNEVTASVDNWYFVLTCPTYELHFILIGATTLRLKKPVGWHDQTITTVIGDDILWKFTIDGDTLNVYRDGAPLVTGFTLPAKSFAEGYMWISAQDGVTSYTDYYTLEDKT